MALVPQPDGSTPRSLSGSPIGGGHRRLPAMTPQTTPPRSEPVYTHDARDESSKAGSPSVVGTPSQLPGKSPLGDSRNNKLSGVHSILNPPPDSGETHKRKRSGAQAELPSPAESTQGMTLPPLSRPGSVSHGEGEGGGGGGGEDGPRAPHPRHNASPRSPGVHRTQSLGMMKPTGSIDAHQSPFVPDGMSSSGATAVHHHHPQGVAPSPPVQRVTYVGQPSRNAPTPPSMAPSSRRPSGSMVHSASASPATSYSTSFSQPGQRSPPSHYGGMPGPTPPPSYGHPAQMPQGGGGHHHHHHHHGSNHNNHMDTDRHYGIPVVSAGQSSYQIMTLETQQGHAIQIPVDVQAASRVADEKRKRNAGASARFRARRKEKEREASTTIGRLEAELREATEDAEFYRRERDYLAQLVLKFPGAEQQYMPRPTSPRHRRTSIHSSNSSIPSSGSGSKQQSVAGGMTRYPDRSDGSEPERNVRRRISSYHPPTGASAGTPMGGGTPDPTYANGAGASGMPLPSMVAGQGGPHTLPMPNHGRLSPPIQGMHDQYMGRRY